MCDAPCPPSLPGVQYSQHCVSQIRSKTCSCGLRPNCSDESSSYGSLNKDDVLVAEPIWGSTEVMLDQTGGKGACHGDSGGPAYAMVNGQMQLFGITSRGVGDGTGPQCTHFSVYTNASAYASWIAGIIGQ